MTKYSTSQQYRKSNTSYSSGRSTSSGSYASTNPSKDYLSLRGYEISSPTRTSYLENSLTGTLKIKSDEYTLSTRMNSPKQERQYRELEPIDKEDERVKLCIHRNLERFCNICKSPNYRNNRI